MPSKFFRGFKDPKMRIKENNYLSMHEAMSNASKQRDTYIKISTSLVMAGTNAFKRPLPRFLKMALKNYFTSSSSD